MVKKIYIKFYLGKHIIVSDYLQNLEFEDSD